MYIITRENPTYQRTRLSHPQFWTGKQWDWLEKKARHYKSETGASRIVERITSSGEGGELKITIELHEFKLEKYKTWQGKDWYNVLRYNSGICVGSLGYSESKIFGHGWKLRLYIGDPARGNFEEYGFKDFKEVIASAENFLGGKIKFDPSLAER